MSAISVSFHLRHYKSVIVKERVKTSEHCVRGLRHCSVLASPRYRYHPALLWHDGRKMIRGTGDNGVRDLWLYLGQRQSGTAALHSKEKLHKRAPFLTLKHSCLLQESRTANQLSYSTLLRGSCRSFERQTCFDYF